MKKKTINKSPTFEYEWIMRAKAALAIVPVKERPFDAEKWAIEEYNRHYSNDYSTEKENGL